MKGKHSKYGNSLPFFFTFFFQKCFQIAFLFLLFFTGSWNELSRFETPPPRGEVGGAWGWNLGRSDDVIISHSHGIRQGGMMKTERKKERQGMSHDDVIIEGKHFSKSDNESSVPIWRHHHTRSMTSWWRHQRHITAFLLLLLLFLYFSRISLESSRIEISSISTKSFSFWTLRKFKESSKKIQKKLKISKVVHFFYQFS